MMAGDRMRGAFEPFIGFYAKHKISPVRQDISDIGKHYSRRDYLYRYLGISPLAVRSRSVIEFGPGSGHNALFTTSLGPSRYVLVDANPTGLEQSKDLLCQYYPEATCHAFVESRIQDFDTDERFSLVLCEGVIPQQDHPAAFARHVGKFVEPGGILVVTTADYVSYFAEVLRRILGASLVDHEAPIEKQLDVLRPIFASHLKTLPGMSRPVDDWILDNILNPWNENLFSIEDAITALSEEFDVYGASPRFLTDWRWYKDIFDGRQRLNERAIEAYRGNLLMFLDCRVEAPIVDRRRSETVWNICRDVYGVMVDFQEHRNMARLEEVAECCHRSAAILDRGMPQTAAALREAEAYFRRPAGRDPAACFDSFRSFFGRAQQYLSFIKRYR